jgi:16S rRNA (uracil1498-N3)-methyltransferase
MATQLPYFFEAALFNGNTQFTLSEETSKHCVQVLRMQEGDQLQLTNGQGDIFTAQILIAHKKNSIVQIIAQQNFPVPTQKIVLGISLLKNAVRLEWLFEKATEMGVHTIVPLLCERTVHERFKMERMQNILQSAMIQSQQAWLPILSTPIAFVDFLKSYKAPVQYIAHCEPTQKTSIKSLEHSNDSILLIGPEGDFSPKEIELACSLQYLPIHLGPTRLRTETAGIFALSVLKNF